MNSSFAALQVITRAALTLHSRAANGIHRADVPLTNAYLKACRLVLPQLGVATLLAFEDLQPHRERPPEECRFALHFCMVAIEARMLQTFLKRDRTQLLDSPGWHQRSAFALTIYGKDRVNAWTRTETVNGEEQFHVWLFVKADMDAKRWEPLAVNETWPRAQGMARLVEVLDTHAGRP